MRTLKMTLAMAGILVTGPAVASTVQPDEISGLQMWLHAGQGVQLDGQQRVQTWEDQSGATVFSASEADEASRPTLNPTGGPAGNPTIEFDDHRLVAEGVQDTAPNEMTIFGVVSTNDLGKRQMIFDTKAHVTNNSGFYVAFREWAGEHVEFRVINEHNDSMTLRVSSDDFSAEDDISVGDHMMIMARIDSTGAITLRVNDAVLNGQMDNPGALAHNRHLGIGGVYNSAADRFDGTVSAALFYNRALNDTEADDVFQHLYNTHIIPEPGMGMSMLGLSSLLLLRRKSKWQTHA
ncbi:hypothetical protein ACERK3_11065 [Phycisphaerales bacterium AB-hyl4]|uniref:LamG domain-containing protein n=1 Tax=Natronomicrosphaera hydrolytica TaxID=3242702 RepID=A0ABV4U776_9BACT